MTSIDDGEVGREPGSLADLIGTDMSVRIVCRRCRFEEDWTPDDLARYLAQIGGTDIWSNITRYLRCRHFGCGSKELRAHAVPTHSRSANMPRRIGRLDAHLIGTALAILDAAAQTSRGQAVATMELRLALLVVHRYARDGNCVRHFWKRASTNNRSVDDGLAEPLQLIRKRLVTAGWLAPPYLVEPEKTWPWSSPAPPGWKQAD